MVNIRMVVVIPDRGGGAHKNVAVKREKIIPLN